MADYLIVLASGSGSGRRRSRQPGRRARRPAWRRSSSRRCANPEGKWRHDRDRDYRSGSEGRPRRPVAWTRLAWVTLRQHRSALIGAAAFLGVVSVYLLIMGLQINHAYAQVAGCHPASSGTCQQLARAFTQEYWGGGGGGAICPAGPRPISRLMLVVPGAAGPLLGAPVLAREFETGTFRFAWTQGCGRSRWAISKLVLLAAVVTAVTWAFTELFAWLLHAFLADGAGRQAAAAGVRPARRRLRRLDAGRIRDRGVLLGTLSSASRRWPRPWSPGPSWP